MRDVMTTDRPKGRGASTPRDAQSGATAGPARRRAIAAIVAEDFDAFAHARRAAQRKLVHDLEQCATAVDARRWHFMFVTEAARAYAEHALRFDALVDELAFDPPPEL